jgi:hypothetical protein
MSHQQIRVSPLRIGALLLAFTLLLAGTQAQAGQPQAAFASGPTEHHARLTNSYQDLVTLTFSAPKAGYVVLTGCGGLNVDNINNLVEATFADISIGTTSGNANNGNEIGITIPFSPTVFTYEVPFSITTVLPVNKGINNFYMVGIRDSNTSASFWTAANCKLTAILVDMVQ